MRNKEEVFFFSLAGDDDAKISLRRSISFGTSNQIQIVCICFVGV